jgi:ethanolamine utilization protein EutQ
VVIVLNVSENVIREIVKQVITESLGGAGCDSSCGFVKKKAPSGVTMIKTDTVKVERFEQDGVALKDVLTLEEAPRMGAGVMELDHTSFEWTLTYDEYDVVLSGTLEIETNGTVVSGGPGDIIYIPKGSHIHFQTPNKTRYAYFVYPANWSEQ